MDGSVNIYIGDGLKDECDSHATPVLIASLNSLSSWTRTYMGTDDISTIMCGSTKGYKGHGGSKNSVMCVLLELHKDCTYHMSIIVRALRHDVSENMCVALMMA